MSYTSITPNTYREHGNAFLGEQEHVEGTRAVRTQAL